MTPQPSWAELVFLMVHGPDRPMRGHLRHQDDGSPTQVGWARADGDPPPRFVHGSEDVVHAWRWGARMRVTDPDGRVRLISDGTTAWSFVDATGPPLESPADRVGFGLSATELLVRSDAERWLGDDFTHPTGPVGATTYLGRAAWEVELAPPPHKPYPVQLVVDAETGMVLQERNDDGGLVSEWTELTVDEDLDPALFVWTGAVRTWEEQRAEREREIQADKARRAGWALEHLGTQTLDVTLEARIEMHRVEPDGSLYATLSRVADLMRRPTSDAPWPETESGPHDGRWHRWSDVRWDWALATWGAPLSPGALARLQEQLRPR